ncbi:GntR family transcriptional regulator [Glaciecola sp. MH2013]|uniref:GntR family transcriptional regulator n=1 Tax=Glaciecola sp. MH2013 TaxID=2785524 RepID=UPI00189CBED9|nr:GntR family transcriptional regulator [Glaciecola sp. MH2013]MBF7074152.1 GntR family transcriptional regulator [Glaciecola sp. MH2013]
MITIDLDSAEPLFNQLVLQIKRAVESELLQPGDALPSIRQLASDLELNAKTVAKAYRLLERDKVLESRGAKGSFVANDALRNLSFDINEWLQTQLSDDVEKYRAAGATDSEIRNVFNQVISAGRN